MKPTAYSLQSAALGLFRSVVRLPPPSDWCPAFAKASVGRLASGVWRRLHGSSFAFTLIELLVVMVIAVVIMAVSLPSFISIGRGAGMRTAVNNVSSTIALSRQWAITHREEITFVASSTGLVYNMTNGFSKTTNDHACYYAISAVNTGLIQRITDLPLDVTFESSSSNTFKTDGGLASGVAPQDIKLVDKTSIIRGDKITKTITINGLTGGIKVE